MYTLYISDIYAYGSIKNILTTTRGQEFAYKSN